MDPACPSGPAQTSTTPVARATLRGAQGTGENMGRGMSYDRDFLGAATSSLPQGLGHTLSFPGLQFPGL